MTEPEYTEAANLARLRAIAAILDQCDPPTEKTEAQEYTIMRGAVALLIRKAEERQRIAEGIEDFFAERGYVLIQTDNEYRIADKFDRGGASYAEWFHGIGRGFGPFVDEAEIFDSPADAREAIILHEVDAE